MQAEFTMANPGWPKLEKRMDHQLEIEDDLDSEARTLNMYIYISCSSIYGAVLSLCIMNKVL